jgi:hypothetical protein
MSNDGGRQARVLVAVWALAAVVLMNGPEPMNWEPPSSRLPPDTAGRQTPTVEAGSGLGKRGGATSPMLLGIMLSPVVRLTTGSVDIEDSAVIRARRVGDSGAVAGAVSRVVIWAGVALMIEGRPGLGDRTGVTSPVLLGITPSPVARGRTGSIEVEDSTVLAMPCVGVRGGVGGAVLVVVMSDAIVRGFVAEEMNFGKRVDRELVAGDAQITWGSGKYNKD